MLKDALLKNLEWFEKSGVMIPENGLWGVAERVAVSKGNSAIDKMKASFPAWTDHGDYCIIEQRRADCNFQAAYMFLLASRALNDKKYYEIGVNILDFLYFRSGLLERGAQRYIHGSWNWSHIKRESVVWVDDESWCIYLQLAIAEAFPELEEKYEMRHWAMVLGREMQAAVMGIMVKRDNFAQDEDWWTNGWLGRVQLPHWGALAMMAMSKCYAESQEQPYLNYVEAYHNYLLEKPEAFIVSEKAYALIGEMAAYLATNDEKYLKAAELFGNLITSRMDASGNIPAEHYEAPTGKHLVDTIYTVNWALLGLQKLASVNAEYQTAFDRLLSLVLRIQDKTSEPQFHGCWRGMFDLNANSWGGGDCYEGGANSIYTGWTNAPISLAILHVLLQR